MKGKERRQAIFDLARSRGYVSIEAIAETYRVSQQTARRDIQLLCERDLLVREHGGASLPPSVIKINYSAKKIDQLAEKETIASAVARHIPDNSTLFLGMGTTIEFVAKALCQRRGLKIITNNLHAASTLYSVDGFDLSIAGGSIRHHNGSVHGPRCLDFIGQFRADFAVVGTSAIARDGALLDFYEDEVAIARAMIAGSARAMLVADRSKFTRTASVMQGQIAEFHALFTDSAPPEHIADILRKSGTELHICEGAEQTAQ